METLISIALLIYGLSLAICYIIDVRLEQKTYHKYIPIFNTWMLIRVVYLIIIDEV